MRRRVFVAPLWLGVLVVLGVCRWVPRNEPSVAKLLAVVKALEGWWVVLALLLALVAGMLVGPLVGAWLRKLKEPPTGLRALPSPPSANGGAGPGGDGGSPA
jgi:hypothetical protein